MQVCCSGGGGFSSFASFLFSDMPSGDLWVRQLLITFYFNRSNCNSGIVCSLKTAL